MTLRSWTFVFALAVSSGALVGCGQPLTAAQLEQRLPGRYVFVSTDQGSPHPADTLVLKPGGDCELSSLKPPSGCRWRLIEGGSQPSLIVASKGYSVDVRRGGTRLILDPDMGWEFRRTAAY
jgi:hypothetical protein